MPESLILVAACLRGTAFVGLVIAGVRRATRWAAGKSTGNSDNADKGLGGGLVYRREVGDGADSF